MSNSGNNWVSNKTPWIDYFHTFYRRDLNDAFDSVATKLGAGLAYVDTLVSEIPLLGQAIREGVDHWLTGAGALAAANEDKGNTPALAGDAVAVALSVGLNSVLSGLAAQARTSIFAYLESTLGESVGLAAADAAAAGLAIAVGDALIALGVSALVIIDTIIAAKEVQAILGIPGTVYPLAAFRKWQLPYQV